MKRDEKPTENKINNFIEESQLNMGNNFKDIIKYTIKEETSNKLRNLNIRDNINKICEESLKNEYNKQL